MEISRREVLKTAAVVLVDFWAGSRGLAERSSAGLGRKVVMVTCGGIRREDTFSDEGILNIPHLRQELLPNAVFYPALWNRGVTSHYNTISSVLSGEWQRLDDWGKSRPASPTVFEQLRRQARLGPDQAWLISSNKALTSQIGASSVREYGPAYGANVLFPKQLLINAVVRAAATGHAVSGTDRVTVRPELEAMLNRDNYDGLGWSISGETSSLDAPTFGVLQQAIDNLIRTNAPVTGDEFTFLVSAEVMRRFAPDLLVMTLSDMEVAHFGSYSLHLAGIHTVDRLASELWKLIEDLPAYKGKTTLFLLPEFGRDVDGSPTNGFFNHRHGSVSTRLTWMMCMGDAIRKPTVVENPVEQTDICVTLMQMFGLNRKNVSGTALPGLWL